VVMRHAADKMISWRGEARGERGLLEVEGSLWKIGRTTSQWASSTALRGANTDMFLVGWYADSVRR
jgi:hypothetical protein